MTMVTDPPQVAKGRRGPKRLRFFQLRFLIEGDTYTVTPLPIDPDVGRKAFRVRKLTGKEQAVYDVRFAETGPECQCLGWLRHRHCKHVSTLQVVATLFESVK